MTDEQDDELRDADARIDEASKEKRSQADRLVTLAIAEARLFHTPDEAPYAVLDRDGAEQTWKLHSKRFRSWLSRRHHEEHDKTPGAQAIQDALNVLDGVALFDGPEEIVYTRTARRDGRIYLDLANDAWSVVEVTCDGWAVVPRSPVRFRRPAGMLPLPDPISGKAQLDDFRELLNIADDEDWLLTVGWLLGTLMGDGPYPIKELVGEAGSAKTTHARLTRATVDPASAPVRRPPREGRDLMIAASNGLVVALDNLSDLSDWLADDLCRLATGGGFATRQLYTDDDEVIFNAMRPIILTGIGGVGEDRNDLPDRTLRIRKPRIGKSKRRKSADVDAVFARLHPGILGLLLDATAVALDTAGTIAFEGLPRMADFAAWAEAGGRELRLGGRRVSEGLRGEPRKGTQSRGRGQRGWPAACRHRPQRRLPRHRVGPSRAAGGKGRREADATQGVAKDRCRAGQGAPPARARPSGRRSVGRGRRRTPQRADHAREGAIRMTPQSPTFATAATETPVATWFLAGSKSVAAVAASVARALLLPAEDPHTHGQSGSRGGRGSNLRPCSGWRAAVMFVCYIGTTYLEGGLRRRLKA